MLDLNQYDGIIFDMDGTLIDSMGAHIIAWEKACKAFGYPFDMEYMNSLGGVPVVKTVEMLNSKHGLSHPPLEVAKAKRKIFEEMAFIPPLIEEIYQVFKHYLPFKKVGIGTGAEHKHAKPVLTYHGLYDKVHALVTSTEVAKGKPHPETFLKVAELLNVDPTKCVVFEDTQIGVQAAIEAGMDYKLVNNGIIQR